MTSKVKHHFRHFKDRCFRQSALFALLLFLMSLCINFYGGIYATERASNPVTDIILSNTPVYDLDGVFIYGSWALAAFITALCFRHPHKSPFILKSISLFVLVRAVFISLTHLGPFPHAIAIDPQSYIRYFVFGGDLFFSGHTGLPFLMALIFWKDKRLRYAFLAASAFFAVVVLLAHLHYTIDVLSAFFITYGIFHASMRFFRKDLAFFAQDGA
jgi:hypothetical protein